MKTTTITYEYDLAGRLTRQTTTETDDQPTTETPATPLQKIATLTANWRRYAATSPAVTPQGIDNTHMLLWCADRIDEALTPTPNHRADHHNSPPWEDDDTPPANHPHRPPPSP